MKILPALFLGAMLAGAAQTGHAAPLYADNVVSFTQGPVERVVAGRNDPMAALGAEDGKFVSLGFGGSLILTFGQPFRAIGQIIEVTFNDRSKHKESADVYAGDGVTWTLIASVKNHLSTSFSAAGIFTHLKIVDTSDAKGATFDGFDIDAVSVSPVPVPAAGLLLGGALFGLGALRRRKRAA